ncbi:Retrovirus-related Pol poly from transposon TNT 1-94 [Paramuricea clavata]|uniref:Retrovirus-related Pol poly from transposon TNT 1-94 n=1 Tax=Paramuricea clavata TaxID=317549 RepID=A0A6S7K408_PARCT|nr:Retrovirus-related Pol poly from transposon TNT 1-94 [Paramuricea clavata]
MLKVVTVDHVNIAKEDSNLKLWHYRYGHLGMDNVNKLMKGEMVQGMDCVMDGESDSVCEGCIMGKQHRTKYPSGVAKRATEPFELVHSDHKDEVLAKFKEFVNLATNLTGKSVKTLRTDNGGEYCSKEFESFLKEKGIVHQLTVPYNPAQNGVSERMNRTLVESARSMMSHGKTPVEFWAEAINTAVYLRNRSPTTSLKEITPYECLFKQKPDVSNLRVFGCEAFAHIPQKQRKKFDEKSRKAVFIGYPEGTKGYKLYDPSTRKFIRSRDIVFVEGKFHDFKDGCSGKTCTDFYIPVDDDIPQVEIQDVPAVVIEVNLTADINEPVHIQEAWTGDHSVEWKEATDSEYESLMKNDTWELVPPPKGKNIVGSRWVFKVKHTADGSVERFKARLVAQGYSQSQGIDYQEIFSPVLCTLMNTEMLKKEKEALAKRFQVEDMGEVNYVLGMSVKRNREARTLITINQPKYLEGVLKRFGMQECKALFQRHWNQGGNLNHYQRMIHQLMFESIRWQ